MADRNVEIQKLRELDGNIDQIGTLIAQQMSTLVQHVGGLYELVKQVEDSRRDLLAVIRVLFEEVEELHYCDAYYINEIKLKRERDIVDQAENLDNASVLLDPPSALHEKLYKLEKGFPR